MLPRSRACAPTPPGVLRWDRADEHAVAFRRDLSLERAGLAAGMVGLKAVGQFRAGLPTRLLRPLRARCSGQALGSFAASSPRPQVAPSGAPGSEALAPSMTTCSAGTAKSVEGSSSGALDFGGDARRAEPEPERRAERGRDRRRQRQRAPGAPRVLRLGARAVSPQGSVPSPANVGTCGNTVRPVVSVLAPPPPCSGPPTVSLTVVLGSGASACVCRESFVGHSAAVQAQQQLAVARLRMCASGSSRPPSCGAWRVRRTCAFTARWKRSSSVVLWIRRLRRSVSSGASTVDSIAGAAFCFGERAAVVGGFFLQPRGVGRRRVADFLRDPFVGRAFASPITFPSGKPGSSPRGSVRSPSRAR